MLILLKGGAACYFPTQEGFRKTLPFNVFENYLKINVAFNTGEISGVRISLSVYHG